MASVQILRRGVSGQISLCLLVFSLFPRKLKDLPFEFLQARRICAPGQRPGQPDHRATGGLFFQDVLTEASLISIGYETLLNMFRGVI